MEMWLRPLNLTRWSLCGRSNGRKPDNEGTKNPTRTGKSKRGNNLWEWAWVDSNYRPYAYQAVTKQVKSRQNAVILRVGRTICRTFPANMPDFAGIYRHTNRPNRHRDRHIKGSDQFSICSHRTGTRVQSWVRRPVRSEATISPVSASTVKCNSLQALLFGGSRRCPTWLLSPVLSMSRWIGRSEASLRNRASPSFLRRRDRVV